MTGALVGLAFGVGVLLIGAGVSGPARQRSRPGVRARLAEMLAQAGLVGVSPGGLVGSCAGVGALAASLVGAVSRSPSIAAAFGLLAGYAPLALVRLRQRRRRAQLRELWPEAVDNLASAVRAGLSLPEALAQLGVRGPESLRAPFSSFGADYRVTGAFGPCLDRLKDALADPVGDRVVESLRVARDVGGSDLGRLLRTLSAFLREDARTRGELESRQSWTVNAARLAVAAPWIVLLLLSMQPEAVAAYNSSAGLVVLAGGGAASLLAYRVMLRIGRLPEEPRVLR